MGARPAVGTECVGIGWGIHNGNNGIATVEIKRSAVERIEFANANANFIGAVMVTGISDSGDSGGPLLCGGNITSVVFGGSDGLWPLHQRTTHTTIDRNWIIRNLPYRLFSRHLSTGLSTVNDAFGDFTMADVDGDGLPDLVYIKRRSTETGHIELHVLSGASDYQRIILSTGTGLSTVDDAFGDFTMADMHRNGTADLVFVKRRATESGTIELHVLPSD